MRSLPRTTLIVTLLMGAALGGCSTNLKEYTGSIGSMNLSAPGNGSIESLAARYDARPGEKRASLDYAAALRARGQLPQTVAVLQRASVSNVGDRDVAAAYGKALADSGRFEEALTVLSEAHTEDRPNWQVLSAMGSIHDQTGRHERARELYTRALQIAPRQPSVLNNLGLSYMLTQNLAQAEATLAEAAAQPGADQRVAANLALARSLQAKNGGTDMRAAPAQKARKVSAAGAAFDLKTTTH